MEKDIKKALELARKDYSKGLKVESIGENETYKVINMDSDEILDGLSCPMLVINKKTGQTQYGFALDFLFDPKPGFEKFNPKDLVYVSYNEEGI